MTAGHYAVMAADRETFRSCGMVNRKRPAEMTGPLVRFGISSNKQGLFRAFGRIAAHRHDTILVSRAVKLSCDSITSGGREGLVPRKGCP